VEINNKIADGLSNKEIAQKLSIEPQTVKNHIHNILDKMQLHNRIEAVQYCPRTEPDLEMFVLGNEKSCYGNNKGGVIEPPEVTVGRNPKYDRASTGYGGGG